MEISNEKINFLKSIGIDINNLAPDFKEINKGIDDCLSSDEIDFVQRESLTGVYKKRFCIKDVIGTNHPDYENKNWIEAFLKSKRGDSIIDKYYQNPEYYSVGLKQEDQSRVGHDSPLELLESDGKFIIAGGNNRINFLKIKYLAEISKAKSEEERKQIDEKYTFIAEVHPIPKDKDIVYIINMIKNKNKNKKLNIKRTADNEIDCQYEIQLDDEIFIINSKEDLEKVLRKSYNLENIQSIDELRKNIVDLIQDGFFYENSFYKDNKGKVLNNTFPELQTLKNDYNKLRSFGLEEQLYNEIDIKKFDFSDFSNKVSLIVEKEEKQREEQRLKIEKQKEEERKRIEEEERIKQEEKEKQQKIEAKRKQIQPNTDFISTNLRVVYFGTKQIEDKYSDLANRFGLSYSPAKIDKTDIYYNINQVDNNLKIIYKKIEEIDNLEELEIMENSLNEAKMFSKTDIRGIYSDELRELFEKAFVKKVEDLLANSKLEKLQKEKEIVESEKVSIFGKILGKERLKNAKLLNIDLNMNLIKLKKDNIILFSSMEESISDLNSYIIHDLKGEVTPEIRDFMKAIKKDETLRKMVNYEEIKKMTQDKVKTKQHMGYLVPINEEKMSNKRKATILDSENKFIEKEIDSYLSYNSFSDNLKRRDGNSSLCKFNKIILKIKEVTDQKEEDKRKNKDVYAMGD